jgi:long-chain acyl-CoA synthetase
MSHRSIHELLEEVCTSHPQQVAFRYKRDGAWRDMSWGEARDVIRRTARALMALGIEKGSKVGILSQTRLEWTLCDLGTVSCGGVTVGIYPSNLAADCAYIVNHSDAELIVVENGEQLEKILSVRDELTGIRAIVILDGDSDPDHGVLSWNDFLQHAEQVDEPSFEQRAAAIEPDDLASLVYTSGTTGVPKGAMISNGNLLFSSDSALRCMAVEPGYTTLLFLPLAHVFARLVIYLCLRQGTVTLAFAEDMTKVAENLREIQPQFIASVPRIFEKVYDRIITGAREAGGLKEKLFNWSIGVGRRASLLQQAGKPLPFVLGLQHGLADRLVFSKIRGAMGGRLRWAIAGAAPMNQSIAEFFHACGLPILEGIGMTENTSFSNVNRYDNNKFGTVGPAGPGIEVRIAEDGEVLFRGANVMLGYYKNPEATAETIDENGWLHTGDIGELDDDGFLRITDRKKDLIVTAGGKNVAPQRIERILRTSPYISQAVAIGDKRKFISALVTLDSENIGKWCQQQGVDGSAESIADNDKVNALIEGEIESRNAELASFESVKKFRILPGDFTIEGGELTPTMKIKRKVVREKYAAAIEELYAD